ncbi:MAG: BRCT domain-containing protein [Deltaproteobacteria bacterium]|nr:BRCT domain-containing protein [Deltaproteobacteria bacterium]
MILIPDGTSFLFVGKLMTMTREQARLLVTSLGGRCPSGVSKDLDYLVVGNENSPIYGKGEKKPKQLKAEAMIDAGARIAIINEQDFLNMVGEQQAAVN